MKFTKLVACTLASCVAVSTLLTGCGSINKEATLITIENGDKTDTITLGYANFVARFQQALYDQYYRSTFGDTMWTMDLYGEGNTFEEDVKSEVLESIETAYVSKLHADEYEVSLTDTETEELEEAVTEFMENNTEEGLEQMGATEEYVRDYLTYSAYAYKVEEAIRDSSDVTVSDEEAIQSTISYVLYSTTTTDDDGETVDVEDDEKATLLEQAEALSASGDNFDTLAEEQEASVESYSYTASEDASEDETLPEEVITTAQAMSDGEISSVIEVDGEGYYVIRMDATYDEDATESAREDLLEEAEDEYYDGIIEGWEDEITWTVDEKLWEKVSFDELFETLTVEDEEEDTEETTDETTDDTESTDETAEDAESTDATAETTEETTEEAAE